MLSASLSCELAGHGTASQYADKLLCSLGTRPQRLPGAADDHPAIAWARSGLMQLTGRADGAPRLCPAPLASCADGALAALASLAPPGTFADPGGGAVLLAERAAIAGFRRAGAVSPGGGCRLLETGDGVIAISLARDEDWELVPAWLEGGSAADWEHVAAAVATRNTGDLVERGCVLGLAVAASASSQHAPARWYSIVAQAGAHRTEESRALPLVVDLSSLWAGPLCSHLLQKLGAKVIKVESPDRPDGARLGPAAFYDLLNAGKHSVALDLHTIRGRRQLHALLLHADIVIEGSRPRALRQLGLHAEEIIQENPRLSWIGISGYGRGEPLENRVAFGDDAGVAAGLSQLLQIASGERLICGDAIADPLTGLHAALVAWSSFLSGGGRLISIALHNVVRHCIEFDTPVTDAAIREREQAWTEVLRSEAVVPSPPRARAASAAAAALGADTRSLLAELGIAC